MSLFPAYSNDNDESSVVDSGVDREKLSAPSWLSNTSFKDFQDKVNQLQPIEIASDSDSDEDTNKGESREKFGDSILISSDSDNVSSKCKPFKGIKTLSQDKFKYKSSKHSKSSRRSRSRSGSRRRQKHSSKRSRGRTRSRSSSRHKYNRKRKYSRSRSRDRRRHRHSRSKSGSRERKVSKNTLGRPKDEIIANSSKSAKKVFVEEVDVSLSNAFREDIKGDRTNLAGLGFYAKDVAKYKSRLRYPLGKTRRQYMLKSVEDNPRFHHKAYVKQLLKSKSSFSQFNQIRSLDELKGDFLRPYLSLNIGPQYVKLESEEHQHEKDYNPLGIYSSATENYLKGIGGLEESENEVFENNEIQQKRMEFNIKLRESPTNIGLWLEFIDYQDEALKETVFQLNDENMSKKSRKRNGEILRAKALTERKLAICKSAIEKNTRSIDLAVKRLELSRDLLDSKTLDQQWKELIFVYPENIALWKRYLLFIQTHYIRFSVPDTIKAYKGCIFKLRKLQEKYVEEGENARKLIEIEHGIVDILDSATLMLTQSGHSEKAVAVYQGLLELNLYSPSLPGYNVDDKLSLFEPIWDSGVNKVGQSGARGWGTELQERIGEGREVIEDIDARTNDWEEKIMEESRDKGSTWIQLELGREREHFFPWKKGEEDAEDPERVVDFDTISGFLVQLSREEVKFRILVSTLRLVGFEVEDSEFSNLLNSEAAGLYHDNLLFTRQDFQGGKINVFQHVLPSYKTHESLAIFTHFIFAQTYNKFSEPFRTKIICLWLDFECELLLKTPHDKVAKKNLKKLVKSLLKEDRNNVELVVKYANIEFLLSGFEEAHVIIETSLCTSQKAVLDQKFEENLVSAALFYRAGVEMELREICRKKLHIDEHDDSENKDRLQWMLVLVGSGTSYKPLTNDSKMSMLALVDSARINFETWISENINNVRSINTFKLMPFVRHSLVEIIFFQAWLIKFTNGWMDSISILEGYSKNIEAKIDKKARFSEEYLTLKYIHESIDKIAYDILYYESLHDVKVRQNLRSFYTSCLQKHPNSGYILSNLQAVEGSTSVVSSVWREVCRIVQSKQLVNQYLVEQVLKMGLTKFVKVLDPESPGNLPSIGLGFLNKLHNILEYFTTLPNIRHSPIIWRMFLWTTSVLKAGVDSSEACESLKTMLYRAIQDVPWCKALYLDTALYLSKIDQLYCTVKKEIIIGGEYENAEDVEDEVVEPKFEEIPGTLEHITDLMIEKDLRVRLPLQELEVLLEPV